MLLVPLVVIMAGAFVARQVAAFGEHADDLQAYVSDDIAADFGYPRSLGG
jgi:hypothetical protein